MTQENLRAALVAAAAMYPEGYKTIRSLTAITAAQEMQMIVDRAEDLAAWLDAKERGETVTAAQITASRSEQDREIQAGASERIFGDPDMLARYTRWLDEHRMRDNTKARKTFLAAGAP